MRKYKTIIIVGIAIILVVITIILGTIISKENDVSITTFKKSYNYLTTVDEENEEMEVLLYITNKNASLTDINKINNCKLYDDESEINLLIKKITYLDYSQNIKGDIFHLFSFVFELPKISTNISDNNTDCVEVKMKTARLQLNLNNYDIDMGIGSFYYASVPSIGNENLSISKLKPIVNMVNTNKTLVGLNIGFTNNTNKELIINKITFLENGIYASTNNIKKNELEFQSSEDISKILGYKYNCLDTDENKIEDTYLVLDANETVEYIVPIKYETEYPVSSCGIMINFSIDGVSQKLYFDDFLFFKDNTISYPSNNIEILKYDDR